MRFYFRTSRHTGVSLGPVGATFAGLLWFCLWLLWLPIQFTIWIVRLVLLVAMYVRGRLSA